MFDAYREDGFYFGRKIGFFLKPSNSHFVMCSQSHVCVVLRGPKKVEEEQIFENKQEIKERTSP